MFAASATTSQRTTSIARAATARPWILWHIAEKLGISGKPAGREHESVPTTPEEEAREYYRALLQYIDLVVAYFGDGEYGLQKTRFFAATGSKWFLFGHSFWRITMKAKSLAEMRVAIAEYAASHQNKMYGRVTL